MKEDWTKQMKQKLEDHQMEPPAGLWEGISREMGFQTAPVVAPKSVASRRWYWAAAAAVLAIVGFFALYQFDTSEPQLVASSEPQLVANHEKAPTPVASDAQPSMPQEAPTLLAQAAPRHRHTPAAQQPALAVVSQQAAPEANPQEAPADLLQEPTETIPQDVASVSEPAPDAPNVQVQHEKKQTYLPEVVDPKEIRSKSNHSDKWTIALNGSNGLLMASNNIDNQMGIQLLKSDAYSIFTYQASYGGEFLNHNGSYVSVNLPEQAEIKHKLPIRFGLTVQYQLNNRLALHGGISYTYLESEFKMPFAYDNSYTQKLKYLGIPLGVSWQLWSQGGFGVYLSGGALIEKCVDSKMTKSEINERPWQFSLNAAAGAEYHFTRQFGLYLEPSLGYYFDDGTSLEHYYKEHPLAPSLQFGLRLHLK